jgi:hypothetical protein
LDFLLERMQHVSHVADRGQIDDPVGPGPLTYSDLGTPRPIDLISFQSDGSSPICT